MEYRQAEDEDGLNASGLHQRIEDLHTPGKLLVKITSNPDGSQVIDTKLDKTKIFVRPFHFYRLAHFFGEGYPVYDKPDGVEVGEWPNSYESDMEKVAGQKIRLEVLDSMLCFDSFAVEDLVNTHMNQAFLGFRASAMQEDPLKRHSTMQKETPAEAPDSASLTTIVARCERIDYTYNRLRIDDIKKGLYENFKESEKERDGSQEAEFPSNVAEPTEEEERKQGEEVK